MLEMQRAKKFPDGLPGVRIQISGGLIGEQQPWFPDEGASERHSLLLASRKFPGPVVCPLAQAHFVERLAS